MQTEAAALSAHRGFIYDATSRPAEAARWRAQLGPK